MMLIELLALVLIVLKATGFVSMSWWLVLIPVYIIAIIYALGYLVVFIGVSKMGGDASKFNAKLDDFIKKREDD